jgi:hypothetical protein
MLQGHYTDQHGRLGRFPTLTEFLQSKIAKLATHPLQFVRAADSCSYVLLDEQVDSEVLAAMSDTPATTERTPVSAVSTGSSLHKRCGGCTVTLSAVSTRLCLWCH